jgi:hypothetical protein
MSTITKRPKGQNVYILVLDNQILGVWTNLTKLCVDRNAIENFVSYSKISKDIAIMRQNGEDKPILEVKTTDKIYKIHSQPLI